MDQTFTYKINDLENINAIIDCSVLVFRPSPEELERYHNAKDWTEKTLAGGRLISAMDGDKVVGFCLGYKKDDETFHLWNAGVLTEYQGKGIWHKMFAMISEFAEKGEFKYLTLNTFKSKFDNMYNFAVKHGFTEYKTAQVVVGGVEATKSYFRKSLD